MLKNKLRIDLKKNTKLFYYIKQFYRLLIPDNLYKKKLEKLVSEQTLQNNILNRVNYYFKYQDTFTLSNNALTIEEFIKTEKKKTYYFDLLEYLRYFDKKFKIDYLFGDITTVPPTPTLLKSRPIEGENKNSILMKLNKIRHFIFVDDKRSFEEKKNMLVWRGNVIFPIVKNS
jgi:hypothetical protein